MTTPPDYRLELVHLSLREDDTLALWSSLFDEACTGWNLDLASQLLREAKQASLSTVDRARLRKGEGMLAAQLGDLARATHHLRESLALLEGTAEDEELALVLGDLGMFQRLQGAWGEAVGFHERQLRLTEELGNPHLVAEAHDHLGLDYGTRDDTILLPSI